MRESKSDQPENPDRFGPAELRRLGQYLQKQRTGSGLTLRGLSERAEVGVASIRALEAGRSSPSLTTVLRVVGALGVTIDRAVAEATTAGAQVTVTRRSEGPYSPDGQRLSDGLEDAKLDARRVEVAPGALYKLPDALSNVPSFCMVIDGTLAVARASADRVPLDAGDSYLAQPGEVQAWANTGTASAHLIYVADRTPRDDETRQS
ncbi:Helix-turn-helix domain-containing protein [Salinihabitans flavidus]|uniref:Helix-turn-helix domain-containing protein n=1 Tax=Salinihabitans flavidus TaxID=569882 RepID=A0A1H8VNF5_9RHOB|nr:XRE family transcriptional regulator [Salinihabitans flavidus]SEP16929.1 Helix-turn-helix domain-containing protein [Salinihabitans flavidus]